MNDQVSETPVDRTLVIGYGNPYRHDDGVALVVINSLRHQLGVNLLALDDDGLDTLGYPLDTIMLHQLLPELVPVVANYQRLVFVDAHTSASSEEISVVPILEEYGFQAVTHHLSPQMLLALAKRATGTFPLSHLVSIRGENFDFGEGLSPDCSARVKDAVERILELAAIRI
ncbi:MAG TPA: hydrogenase maturation protease [Terriglobia bacterium]|nr:hydrogenase maturation protease [Terriglobia bacterium]